MRAVRAVGRSAFLQLQEHVEIFLSTIFDIQKLSEGGYELRASVVAWPGFGEGKHYDVCLKIPLRGLMALPTEMREGFAICAGHRLRGCYLGDIGRNYRWQLLNCRDDIQERTGLMTSKTLAARLLRLIELFGLRLKTDLPSIFCQLLAINDNERKSGRSYATESEESFPPELLSRVWSVFQQRASLPLAERKRSKPSQTKRSLPGYWGRLLRPLALKAREAWPPTRLYTGSYDLAMVPLQHATSYKQCRKYLRSQDPSSLHVVHSDLNKVYDIIRTDGRSALEKPLSAFQAQLSSAAAAEAQVAED